MASLFWYKNPYDMEKTELLFRKQMRENMKHHYANCKEYHALLDRFGWDGTKIQNMEDIADIPVLPTLYLKHHRMDSLPTSKMLTRATSSGTSGNKSNIGYDLTSLWRMLGMSVSIGRRHKLFSLRRCRYIILGYEHRKAFDKSHKDDEKAVAKTAYAFTYMAPAKSRIYALRYQNGEYSLQLEAIKEALIKYSKKKTPVRIIGFPFHAYWLLTQMKEEGITCHLPKGSVIAFGGGWKEYYTQRADKETMYKLVEEVLGIPEANCWEFFGAVEHPVLYTTCPKHHFHVPIHSRVLIRDVDTFKPLPMGQPGLVNLLTPMIKSAPVHSIMTDDLGILHEGSTCGCGIKTPYLEILGRVGMDDITTCAAGAEKLSQQIIQEVLK
ncbi:MAG: acyl-protein synthetase [Lachnospiraceae bacterium]|nr:acyl-protein synthetase [Lachnospiraceae bacterium]